MRIIVYADLFDSSEIVYGRYTVSSIEEADQFIQSLEERRLWITDHTHRDTRYYGFRYEVEEEVLQQIPDVSVHLVDLVVSVDTLIGSAHVDSFLPECDHFDHQATIGQVHVIEPQHGYVYEFHLVLDVTAHGYQTLQDLSFERFHGIADVAEEYLGRVLDGEEELLERIRCFMRMLRHHYTVEE